MKFDNINILKKHLVTDVTTHFKTLEKFWDQDTISQFQQVLELIAFCFEDYRYDFIQLMEYKYNNKLIRGQQDIEVIMFISWCSQHALLKLKELEKERHSIYSDG
jgi:hypothetical protein